MKFSLIVPTLHRVAELERLFQSLKNQDYTDFEVIVVDQNEDERLSEVIAAYRAYFPILHLRESVKGQSRARNIGFLHVSGDIAAFPDDDCFYTEGLLSHIARFFNQDPGYDGLVVRIFDLDENENAFEFCGDGQSQALDYAKAYQTGVSCAMFFRAAVTQKVKFDETLGPGAGTRWACGDDTDYLFGCLDAGYRFYYDAGLAVRHPNPVKKNNFGFHLRREYAYGLGKGYFLATHRMPENLLKAERRAPFRRSLSAISTGALSRASYFLINGLGTSAGYRSGLRKNK